MMQVPPKVKDLTGDKIGDWRILELHSLASRDGSYPRHTTWLCRCEACGEVTKPVSINTLNGIKRIGYGGCGCNWMERLTAKMTKHGEAPSGRPTPEYQSWNSMKHRCLNPNNRQYDDYGGRGIAICDRWLNSYENFLEDMGRRPTRGHTLERIDNDGNYELGNCKWATRAEQRLNQRQRTDRLLVTFRGETMTVQDAAKQYDIHPEALKDRLRSGHSAEIALTWTEEQMRSNAYFHVDEKNKPGPYF